MQSLFSVDKVVGEFVSKGLVKRKAPSKDQDGAVVHRLKLFLDVFSADIMEKVTPIFAGCVFDAKAIAAAETKGEVKVAKQKLGVVACSIYDFREGNLLFTDPLARAGIPRLIIGDSARTAHLVVDVEIAIPRPQAGLVFDYFRADVMISLAVSQMDLADAAKEAELARKDREANKAASAEHEGKKKPARRGKAKEESVAVAGDDAEKREPDDAAIGEG